ncbi:MAG: hypothetical protein AVDCRST_MAG65-1029 [uncultured Solirubrobacteraceae bacterium]|uniref:Glycosyltransferase RgtA/B/C/D-like domain-containing protein n=1 Tax=uncultured Solirubrobacteraceae bacterium TaxID=1162706 RepID=A0A6J4RTC8_9ACTN|nr:MAG: hypothetical protein AVDCRST_MAG65-1029 [uncultured Solirubrobacteraceae bacterium]
MESAALRRPRDRAKLLGRLRALDLDALARVAFALLCVAFAVGFLLYPTYPNYDSYYSLLWGRELLAGEPLRFAEPFRVPTEHPLAIVAGALLTLFGDAGDRVWIALTFATYLWLVWGIYALGRDSFTPLIGALAALLLLTRFDFGFLAARGYIDIPYMAMVVWAAVLEGRRPRRGLPVFALLAAAGLLRPEGWLLAGLYFLWMAWRADWRRRLIYAALTAIGPLGWAAVDWAVTGDPLFSLHYTSSSAEDLGRQRTLAELPAALPDFFANLIKLPVLVAAVFGLIVAMWAAPRRSAMPFVLFATGLGTFVAIGIAGLSVIERYLTVAALALLVFAAVGIGGWTLLVPSRLRSAWMVAAALLVLGGVAYTATRVNVGRFQSELEFRGASHDSLERVLRHPEVQAGLRCGPLTMPNHKLIPDARWILDLPYDRVLARVDPAVRAERGVAVYATSRAALFRHAFSNPADPVLAQVPGPGFRRVATSPHYAAYVAC